MAMDDQELTDGYRMAGHEILMIIIRFVHFDDPRYTTTFKRLYNYTYEYSSNDL